MREEIRLGPCKENSYRLRMFCRKGLRGERFSMSKLECEIQLNPLMKEQPKRQIKKMHAWILVCSFFVMSSLSFAKGRDQEGPSFRTHSQVNEEFPESRFGTPPTSALLDDPYQLMMKELNQDDSKKRSIRGLASTDSLIDGDLTGGIRDGVLPPSILKSGTQEVSLIAHELGFFPRSIFVTQDVPVRMFVTSASKRALCIMIDELQIRRQVRSQEIEELSFTPTTPGQYRFYCPMNGMEGTLWVRDLKGSLNSQRLQGSSVREEY